MPAVAGGSKVLVVATFGPANIERCPAPFLFAIEAANMGADVSLLFVLQAPLLLKEGIGDDLYAKEGGRSITQFIQETLDAKVKFFVCDAALELCDLDPDDLIEDIDFLVGANFLISQGLKSDLVLSF